jgi:hypothetical protein
MEKSELELPAHAELMLGKKTGLLTRSSHLPLSCSGRVTVTVQSEVVLLVWISCT